MSPEQISRLVDVMTADPDIMAILRGGEKNVECRIQERISKGVESQRKTEKVMVGGDSK